MDVSRLGHWQMLRLLYKYGTKMEDVDELESIWSLEKLKHYVRCQKLSGKRRVDIGTYGANGPSLYLEQIRAMRNPAANLTELAKRKKTKQCLSSWVTHTNNVQKIQGTATDRRCKGRRNKNANLVDHGPLLSKVMLFLSEKEEHPAPSSSSDPDYREIYRYLSQVLAGLEPTELSQGSAAKVLEMIQKVQKVAHGSKDLKRLRQHLNQNMTSYLKPWRKEAESSCSTSSQEMNPQSTVEECPLFQEMIEEEELDQWREEIKNLTDTDPHYMNLKAKIMTKSQEKQAIVSGRISELPGLNPFLLPPYLMYKDEDDATKALLEK